MASIDFGFLNKLVLIQIPFIVPNYVDLVTFVTWTWFIFNFLFCSLIMRVQCSARLLVNNISIFLKIPAGSGLTLRYSRNPNISGIQFKIEDY